MKCKYGIIQFGPKTDLAVVEKPPIPSTIVRTCQPKHYWVLVLVRYCISISIANFINSDPRGSGYNTLRSTVPAFLVVKNIIFWGEIGKKTPGHLSQQVWHYNISMLPVCSPSSVMTSPWWCLNLSKQFLKERKTIENQSIHFVWICEQNIKR